MPPKKSIYKQGPPGDENDELNNKVQTLVRKRASVKSKLTRFENYFKGATRDAPNEATLLELEMRLREIESNLLSEFTEIHFELEGLDPNSFKEAELDAFESSYFSIITEIKQFLLLQSASQYPTHNQVQARHSTGGGPQQGLVSNRKFNTKLPVIELPKFSGQYERWLEFRDMYLSLVHKCDSLEPIEKFHYLRASLEGSAAQCLQSINICAANYDLAWDILCQRFENKRLMVHNHIKALFNIHEIKSDSSSSFRNLVDILSKNIHSLENLGINTGSWDPLVIYLVTSKLDVDTIKEWEQQDFDNDLPSLSELKTFLSSRADFLDKGVYAQSCTKFLALPIQERVNKVKSLKLCENCLLSGHKTPNCRSGHCRHCKQKHNSLLHPSSSKNGHDELTVDSSSGSKDSNQEQVVLYNHSSQNQILLATAVIEVFDSCGGKHSCRALLDSASMSNFIAQEFADRLGIYQEQTSSVVIDIGQGHSNISASCKLLIKSCHSKFKAHLKCLVIPHITSDLPNLYFDPTPLNIPSHCRLADPKFYEPSQVDLLIGAEMFWDLISCEKIYLGPGKPFVQNNKLGWFISGQISTSSSYVSSVSSCNLSKNLDIQNQLALFWELEEVSHKPLLSPEEVQAESLFSENDQRTPEGRFVVSVPLKRSPEVLGDSNALAMNQFLSLERKLAKNKKLKDMYVNFMTEYRDLNHMSLFTPSINQPTFFSPHHGVLREESSTTKLRVVFNSSAVSSSGLSYNSIQMVGPVVQSDLFSIMLRFRQYQYVVSADISKMYRQIQVKDEFRPLQLIFWRSNPDDELQIFSLNTVTYGTASAPFLATRCPKQLALEHESSNPRASQVISKDFYVDDLLSGADSFDEAVQLCLDVSSILKSACFDLRKWKSNCKEILEKLEPLSNTTQDPYFFSSPESSKILGMLWSSEQDKLFFCSNLPSPTKKITKRTILSEISKLYDPLGLISPIIIRAKIMFQFLWTLKLSWDDSVPLDLAQKWLNFKAELDELRFLQIARCVSCKTPISIQLHGFSDASSSAYGACFFVRTIDSDHNVHIKLLVSKTRVAPLKSISIPRLELCGALLLAELFQRVKDSISLKINEVFLWCDSTVTLAWLRSSPSNLQVFVGNRVASIQGLTSVEFWRYVPTEDNPADIISRETSLGSLRTSDVGFHGPNWLAESPDKWPVDISLRHSSLDELPEIRTPVQSLVQVQQSDLFPFHRFSSLTRLIRVTAYCIRFLRLVKSVKQRRQHGPDTGIDYAGPFQIKDRKGRGCKTQKCYLVLFICLTTKAIHLELVTDMSTQAFLETFQRFIARRGKPSNVYSDNGSNFVGANNQLRDLGRFLRSQEHDLKESYESPFNIKWHFIAAYSPHHGGIWEAGIKSAKYHIKRVLFNTLLTFESFYTIITQIESILNSRPLTPLSTDPNDLSVLTPAHFLIGRSLQTIAYPQLQHVPQNRLCHFEQLQSLKQHFWSRWTKEYIGQLQQRVKWKTNQPNLAVGTSAREQFTTIEVATRTHR